MSTQICIDDRIPREIKKTSCITQIIDQSKIILDNCSVFVASHFFDPTNKSLFFKTDKRSSKFLEDTYGKRIFHLKVITDGYFPTLIKLNTGFLDYKTFISMIENNEILITHIDTTIRRISYRQHIIIYNRVNEIQCK